MKTNRLIIEKRVKATLVATGKKHSAEFMTALDLKVRVLVEQATKRATANGRKTVRACDL